MKKKSLVALLIFTFVSCFSAAALAEKKTKTDIEFGVISTSGNTQTNSVKGRVNVKQDFKKFRNNFIAEAFFKEDLVRIEEDNGDITEETQTTSERYFLSAQSDYKLKNENQALFGFVSYEQDEFSNFEFQSTIALGYAGRIFTRDTTYLSYAVGPGFAINEERVSGDSNSTGIVRLSAEYYLQISETSKFVQNLSTEIPLQSGQNRKTRAESALSANLMSNLALKLSFIVDSNSRVAEGIENTDTQSAVTVVYSF